MSQLSHAADTGIDSAGEQGREADASSPGEPMPAVPKRLQISISSAPFAEEKESGLPDVFPCR